VVIYTIGIIAFIFGILIGFAVNDEIHAKVLEGIRKENSKLWAENRVLRGRWDE
jgi:hypothetical protein